MWYINYGLHLTITHSLFKSKSQMCSKLHQISWGKSNGYMFKTNFSSIEHQCNKLGACLKKRGKNRLTCQIFDNQFLSSLKQLKLDPKALFLQSNKRIYVIIIPGVFCPVFDAWGHNCEFILIYHRTKKVFREGGFIFRN